MTRQLTIQPLKPGGRRQAQLPPGKSQWPTDSKRTDLKELFNDTGPAIEEKKSTTWNILSARTNPTHHQQHRRHREMFNTNRSNNDYWVS